jgi:hypothetical protein
MWQKRKKRTRVPNLWRRWSLLSIVCQDRWCCNMKNQNPTNEKALEKMARCRDEGDEHCWNRCCLGFKANLKTLLRNTFGNGFVEMQNVFSAMMMMRGKKLPPHESTSSFFSFEPATMIILGFETQEASKRNWAGGEERRRDAKSDSCNDERNSNQGLRPLHLLSKNSTSYGRDSKGGCIGDRNCQGDRAIPEIDYKKNWHWEIQEKRQRILPHTKTLYPFLQKAPKQSSWSSFLRATAAAAASSSSLLLQSVLLVSSARW